MASPMTKIMKYFQLIFLMAIGVTWTSKMTSALAVAKAEATTVDLMAIGKISGIYV
jgi:hypothetical protein